MRTQTAHEYVWREALDRQIRQAAEMWESLSGTGETRLQLLYWKATGDELCGLLWVLPGESGAFDEARRQGAELAHQEAMPDFPNIEQAQDWIERKAWRIPILQHHTRRQNSDD